MLFSKWTNYSLKNMARVAIVVSAVVTVLSYIDTQETKTSVIETSGVVVHENMRYVIAGSLGTLSAAKKLAEVLSSKHYRVGVFESTTGVYAITVGHLSIDDAKRLVEQGIRKGDLPNDTFLHDGTRLIRQVWP